MRAWRVPRYGPFDEVLEVLAEILERLLELLTGFSELWTVR